MDKQRLFVDIDGTLAKFVPVDTLEKLYEPGYFLNLEPQENMIAAVKNIMLKEPDIEVFILSSVLEDSKYACKEKNQWIDWYIPEIDIDHRIYPPCGADKKDFVPGRIRSSDCLLDDYSKNLLSWQPLAKGIKVLNGINHNHGSWKFDCVKIDHAPLMLAEYIVDIMNGKKRVCDNKIQGSKVISSDIYVCQLPQIYQEKIRKHIQEQGITGEDLQNGMDSRLCDLGEILPVKNFLDYINSTINNQDSDRGKNQEKLKKKHLR